MPVAFRLPLQVFFEREARHPRKTFLVQPAGVPTISLPLCPPGTFDFSWADLQACTPIQDNPEPAASDLATIIYTSGTTGLP